MERLKSYSSPPDAPHSPIRVELSKGERYKAEGAIVNVSSISSSGGDPFVAVYAMSKAAIDELTKTMAVELAPRRVRCLSANCKFCLIMAFLVRYVVLYDGI